MKKAFMARILLTILLTVTLCAGACGCGKKQPVKTDATAVAATVSADLESSIDGETQTKQAAEDDTGQDKISDDSRNASDPEPAQEENVAAPESEPDAPGSAESVPDDAAVKENLPDEDGVYTSKDDVALYLHVYGKLPSNFITKKQAKKLGWNGGSLEEYAPGKCIGGDYFGNYEGLLPKDKEYHECDIDTLGKQKRGVRRIVYSDDGYIYYTEDHYESYELLYSP